MVKKKKPAYAPKKKKQASKKNMKSGNGTYTKSAKRVAPKQKLPPKKKK